MVSTTKERLNEIMREKGLRQVDIINLSLPLQKKYNIKLYKSHLSQYVSGKSNPDDKRIFLLSKLLGVTEPWLMGYDVEKNSIEKKFTNDVLKIYNKLNKPRQIKVVNYAKEQLDEQEKEEIDNTIFYNYVPVYGYVSAGTGHYIEDTPIETVRVKGYVPKHDIALWVAGDSMEPVFRDKDIIYINKTKHLYNGQIGVFILDGESYVKKIRIENDGIKLVSLNKKYQDINIKEYSDLHIVGRVII